MQSSVEYEYFKDCFTISCAASFKKVTYLAGSPRPVLYRMQPCLTKLRMLLISIYLKPGSICKPPTWHRNRVRSNMY